MLSTRADKIPVIYHCCRTCGATYVDDHWKDGVEGMRHYVRLQGLDVRCITCTARLVWWRKKPRGGEVPLNKHDAVGGNSGYRP